jgi:hypothetical protein
MKRLLKGVPLLLLVLAAAGCSPIDNAAACEEMQACRGGNDADLEACEAYLDLMEEAQDIQGCSDEYEEWFECSMDSATCESQETGVPCESHSDCSEYQASCESDVCVYKTWGVHDQEVCKSERNAFSHCSEFQGGVY